MARWIADRNFARRVQRAEQEQQSQRENMTDYERKKERDECIARSDKIIAMQVAKAERVRYTLPWNDPHFVSILRRVYRNYIRSRGDI